MELKQGDWVRIEERHSLRRQSNAFHGRIYYNKNEGHNAGFSKDNVRIPFWRITERM